MKYDKDIRTCRLLMLIIGLAQFPVAAAVVLKDHNWISGIMCVLWAWACYIVRRTLDVHQKTRDSQRLIMATIHGRMEEKIRRLTGEIMGDGEEIQAADTDTLRKQYREGEMQNMVERYLGGRPGLQSDQARDASYGYSSYRCPKCGKVSHHPMDVQHKYCAACHGFERSDWRG